MALGAEPQNCAGFAFEKFQISVFVGVDFNCHGLGIS
jgi:hypothetical protein